MRPPTRQLPWPPPRYSLPTRRGGRVPLPRGPVRRDLTHRDSPVLTREPEADAEEPCSWPRTAPPTAASEPVRRMSDDFARAPPWTRSLGWPLAASSSERRNPC